LWHTFTRYEAPFLPRLVTVEREGAVRLEGPVPAGARKAFEVGGTITAMASAAAKIQIPRWIQLVGLPLLLIFLWLVAGAARHVVFLFLVAALIALPLDPVVNAFTAFRV